MTGVVFDKDNCLVSLPIAPVPTDAEVRSRRSRSGTSSSRTLRCALNLNARDCDADARVQESWKSCISTFGREKVLLVSNSAGSSDDPNLIQVRPSSHQGADELSERQAEAVSRSLGVPVLVHDSKKPSRQCALDVARYFSPRPAFPSHPPVPIVWSVPVPPQLPRPDVGLPPRLVVVGDRLTTDVVLASRIRARGPEVVSVLTDRVWEKERVGTRVMRWMEGRALALVERRYGKDPGGWEGCLVATSQERQTEEIAGTTSDPSQSSTPVVFVTTFLSTLMRPIVSRLKRWYDGSLGIGFKTPEGWSRWKRIG